MEIRNLLPNFADLLLDTVFLVNEAGCIQSVSAACERMFGYAPDEMIGRRLIEFVIPEDRQKTLEEAGRVMAGHARIGFENRYLRKDGSTVHIMWSACWSKADRLRIGVARDVSEQKRAQAMQSATYAVSEAVHQATDFADLLHAIHRIIVKLVPVQELAVAMQDSHNGKLRFIYQAGKNDAPPLREEIARRHCEEAIHESWSPMPLPDEALASPSGSANVSACWLVMPLVTSKEPLGVLLLKGAPGTINTLGDKELLHFIASQVATAIERGQLNAELLRSARHDELTGLPNRRLFHEKMRSSLEACRQTKCHAALLFIDIDDFKRINDTLGHAAGDLLLKEIARRLEACLRKEDMVARLGGDEFVVLLDKMRTPEGAQAVAEKIRSALLPPAEIDGRILLIQASIGIALFPEHGTEAKQLLLHADKAMYLEKKNKTFS